MSGRLYAAKQAMAEEVAHANRPVPAIVYVQQKEWNYQPADPKCHLLNIKAQSVGSHTLCRLHLAMCLLTKTFVTSC